MSDQPTLPAALDLSALIQAPMPQLDFVLPGLLRGTVGSLVSPGGLGKSYWTLAVALSMGQDAADLTSLAPAAGRVLILSGEDPQEVLALRLKALAAEQLRQQKSRAKKPDPKMVTHIDFRSCIGLELDLMNKACFDHVLGAADGCRLIVLDTLTRFHHLDENDAAAMKRLLARLESLAKRTNAAVLFLHHTSKAAALNQQGNLQQAARGSSVLVDNARWSAFLSPMRDAEAREFGVAGSDLSLYVRWNVSKQNYGASRPDQWYKRNEEGVLIPVTLLRRAGKSHVQPEDEGTPAQPPLPAGFPAPTVSLPSANNAFGGNW